jgi:hypothetical protein
MSTDLGHAPAPKIVRAAVLAACCLFATFCPASDQPAKPGEAAKSEGAVQPAADNSARRSLDGVKLPPNAVIVVTEEMREALKLVPRAFVLSPEEYQKLLDELQRLRGQPRAEKLVTPTVCRVTGKVEGDLARLLVEFEFHTEARNALVGLGCTLGHPRSVSLDGHLPALQWTTDRYLLQVDEPGAHKATLDLDLAVKPSGTGGTQRGFTLDLPRAPVTTLELDVPAAAKEVRVGRATIATRPHEDARFRRLEAGALGSVDQLDVSWKGPASGPTGPPLLSAEGQIAVQVLSENAVKTTAEIKLEVLRGQVAQWQLQVPPQAVVRLKNPDDRAATIEPKGNLQIIRLKEPTAEPLTVVVEQEQSRGGGPVAVGPFHVLGAYRQRGTILVAVPPDIRPRYLPRSEVSPREVTPRDGGPEFRPTAAFTYWNLAPPEKPQAPPPLLRMEFQAVRGMLDTRADHTLSLTERGWRVTSRFTVRPPLRGEVKELVVELPPGLRRDERRHPNEPAFDIQERAEGREAVITLEEKQTGAFTLTLEGDLPPPVAEAHEAALELPRLKLEQAIDRGGEITVALPPDLELLSPGAEGVRRDGHNRWTLPVERTPGRVNVGWRPYRPDLPFDARVNVELAGAQARVRHELWAPGPQAFPAQVSLRVPEALADQFKVAERGEPVPGAREGTLRLIKVTEPVSRNRPLVLEYWFGLPAPGQPFPVPLVAPAKATRGDIHVRVWSDPGLLPLAEGGAWQVGPAEPVEGHNRLPDLCLQGTRPDLPLVLRLSDAGTVPSAGVTVERALIRATVEQAGQHRYWASFRLSQLRAPHLDLELPAAPSALGLKVLLDGVAVPWHPVPDGGGADTTRLARLTISPHLLARPAVLDVIYQITPSLPAARGSGYALGNVALQTTLHAPQLRGCDHGPVRWDVRLPANWVPIYTGGGFQFEQRWGWRGWLLAPQPAVGSAELEHWFAGDTAERPPEAQADAGPPSVVCWRTDLEPLRLNHAPQQAWLLVCSLAVLAIGLGLYFLLVQRGLYWPVVVLLGVVAALVGLVWPNVLAVIFYGCQPGLVVLLLVFTVLWLLQRRYRRQVVFLPAFTRTKSGSSLIRSSHRPRGEPTTVDAAPPLAGSSSQRKHGSSPGAAGEGGGSAL